MELQNKIKLIRQPQILINAIYLHVAIKQAFKIQVGRTDLRIASAFHVKDLHTF